MSKVCIFFAPGYEEIEALTVVDILRRAEVDIDMVSITDEKKSDRFAWYYRRNGQTFQ